MPETDPNATASTPGGAARTKAQSELDRFRQRAGAVAGGAAEVAGSVAGAINPALAQAQGFMPIAGMVPAWALPPSIAAVPGAVPGRTAADAAGRLGTTARLGVDLVNAALAVGVRALGGLSGTAYAFGGGYGPSMAAAYGCPYCRGYGCSHCSGHGCGCNPCAGPCGGYDCCCLFGQNPQCCQPSVGTCY